MKGWIDLAHGQGTLFQAAGQDFAATQAGGDPARLPAAVSLAVQRQLRGREHAAQVQSHNVVARLEGSDRLKDEYVIYTAHWDHLGSDPNLKGDQIYNGAADNASGVGHRARDRPGVHQGPAGPEALDSLPLRHGRGERTARLQVLRECIRCIRWKPWPTSTST